MKRKVTIDQLREIVRARMTKGSAFRLDNATYEQLQAATTLELEALSYTEIVTKFPEYTYDIR